MVSEPWEYEAARDLFVKQRAWLASHNKKLPVAIRYGAMLDGVSLVALRGVRTIESQAEALRFVVLVDRLYDRDVPVLLGSSGETALFPPAMLAGGYRKKYLRALSRLGALAEEGRTLVSASS